MTDTPRPSNTSTETTPPYEADEGVDVAATTDPASGETPADPPRSAAFPDIADLAYEEARDELLSIVSKLEGGSLDLEASMKLWERGEALAAHCSSWLDGAEARLARGETGADHTD